MSRTLELREVLVLSAVPFIWGGNFAVAKLGVSEYPPIFFIAIRLLATGLILYPFARIRLCDLSKTIQLSLTLGSLNFGFLILAIESGNLNQVLLVYQMNIVFGVIAASLCYGEAVTTFQKAGLILSFLGLTIVLGAPHSSGLSETLFVLASAAAFGYGQIKVRMTKSMDPLAINAAVSILAGLQLAILSLLWELDLTEGIPLPSATVLGSLFYTSVVAGVLAYGIWYRMLQKHPVVLVLPFSLLTPFFGLLITRFLLGQGIDLVLLIGAVVIMLGLSFIVAEGPWCRFLERKRVHSFPFGFGRAQAQNAGAAPTQSLHQRRGGPGNGTFTEVG